MAVVSCARRQESPSVWESEGELLSARLAEAATHETGFLTSVVLRSHLRARKDSGKSLQVPFFPRIKYHG